MPEIAPSWWWNNLDIGFRPEFCPVFSGAMESCAHLCDTVVQGNTIALYFSCQ